MIEEQRIKDLLERIASGDFDEKIHEEADYLWRVNYDKSKA